MSHRNQQVAQELMKGISKVISQKIDREKFGMVTVTDLVVTKGLERASIFISALNNGRTAVRELNKKSFIIKKLLGNIVQLRKIPQLVFIFDISNERTEQIEDLLSQKDKK